MAMTVFWNFLIERILLWVALGLVLWGTYIHFVVTPYLGLSIMYSGRIVMLADPYGVNGEAVTVGDTILKINDVHFSEIIAATDTDTSVLTSSTAGDQLLLTVQRSNSEPVEFTWRVPGVTRSELIFRLGEFWWIGLVFWCAALATTLLVRPKDLKWRLLIAFFLVTAVWLSLGSGLGAAKPGYRVFASSVWLTIPIYLHLHWIYPNPLYPLNKWIPVLVYVLSLPLVVLELLALVPHSFYYVGGLISIGGTCMLVLVRLFVRPDERSKIRIMVIGIALSFLPILFPIVARLFQIDNPFYVMAAFGLPLLPLTYFYAAYRYQLGEMVFRANRYIALYLYFLAVLMAMPLLFLGVNQFSGEDTTRSILSIVVATLGVMVSLVIFPRFQRAIEVHLLSMPLQPERLLRAYSERITATSTIAGLNALLRQDVLPSLLLRQSMLCLWDKHSLLDVGNSGVDKPQLPKGQDVQLLLSCAEKYLPVQGSPLAKAEPRLAWVRLILPLRFDGEVIGFWLLGKRDPDDFYSYVEIEMLASLARQTAVALSNIINTEELRLVYQANVERHELERKKLALVLHDEVLNRQAQILWDLPTEAITPELDAVFHALTDHVRQIIVELRPPLLEYGLQPALEQLIDSYLERNPNADLTFDVTDSEHRYPFKVEEHIFRIVQQALDNALTHAKGAAIRLSGHLEPARISLQISDDGEGFEVPHKDYRRLLMDRRFGLIGMQERAMLINADLQIRSRPGAGTTLTLMWNATDHVEDIHRT